jgi:hypothetical protein
MRLAFLLARQYWPYTKWFGTAFARLPIAAELAPLLRRAIAATGYSAREAALVEANGVLVRAHNAGLTQHVDPQARPTTADRSCPGCRPLHRRLPTFDHRQLAEQAPLVGSVDHLTDSTDLLSSIDIATRLRALYRV